MKFEQMLPYLKKGLAVYRDGMEEDRLTYKTCANLNTHIDSSTASSNELVAVGLYKSGYFLEEAQFDASDLFAEDWFVIGIPEPEEKTNETNVQSDSNDGKRKTKASTDTESDS